jgi:hypothetical protein
MSTFLFWNLDRKPLATEVASLVGRHRVDVLLLAENAIPEAKLTNEIRRRTGRSLVPDRTCRAVHIFTGDGIVRRPVLDRGRLAIRALVGRAGREILLVAAHLPSKLWFSPDDQATLCPEYVRDIRDAEQTAGHMRTVVVGDLNMNPFEAGMVAMNGFHAVTDRRVAARGKRAVLGREYPFFYNPMWRFFGDRERPPGTYYKAQSKPIAYFWHMLDQVLVRPQALRLFDHDALRILTRSGRTRLVDGGKPSLSDHLPILFELDL